VVGRNGRDGSAGSQHPPSDRRGFTLPGDTSETANYFDEDIVDPPVVLRADGFIDIPTGPGIGARVVPERVLKRAIRAERLR